MKIELSDNATPAPMFFVGANTPIVNVTGPFASHKCILSFSILGVEQDDLDRFSVLSISHRK